MLAFIQAHQMGVINGVAWVLALGASHWLSVTDKVAAANFIELIINGFMVLKKKPVEIKPVEKKES